MIHTLLVDDHKIFTEGLSYILANEEDIAVQGTCQSAEQTLHFLAKNQVDIVLLDINLGPDNGLDLCKLIHEKHPSVRILAISMHDEENFITKMLKNGAAGYLLKNTSREELLEAIRQVHAGENYQSKEVIDIVMKSLNRQKPLKNNYYQLHFTRREKEILDLVAKGLTTKEIANALFISEKTVETHRSNLFAKFDVKNVVSLVKMAMEYGYV